MARPAWVVKAVSCCILGHDVMMREDAGAAPGELFPDQLEVGGRRFPLEYHFEPGSPDDGVQITVPIES